jgi:tungstate transport system substrate-binding protein
VLAACALTACNTTRNPTLDIATTTSVVNSGLLAALLPEFASATVRVHATGSGRALEMLARGDVELVITHAPQTRPAISPNTQAGFIGSSHTTGS